MIRGLWCWLRGHERVSGCCLTCCRGPNGQRVRPISGGQDFDFSGALDVPWEYADSAAFIEPGAASSYLPPFTPPSSLYSFASDIGAGLGKGWDWLTSGTQQGQPTSESPLSAFTKLLGLGSTGLGIANQFGLQRQLGKQTRMAERGQSQAASAAAPAVAFGTETLNRAARGELTPALQAGIDQWVQQAKADARSRLASMGLGNSTDIESLDRLIDQQAQAMKGTMLQQQEETGLAGLQTGVSAGTGVMGGAQAQQAMLAQLIQQANQALGQITGRG